MSLAFDSGLFVLIWLVHTVIYPAFREVEPSRSATWHTTYSRRISWFVIPLMFGQLGITIALAVCESSVLNLATLVGVVSAWVSTFLQSVPFHRRLSEAGKTGGNFLFQPINSHSAEGPGGRRGFDTPSGSSRDLPVYLRLASFFAQALEGHGPPCPFGPSSNLAGRGGVCAARHSLRKRFQFEIAKGVSR